MELPRGSWALQIRPSANPRKFQVCLILGGMVFDVCAVTKTQRGVGVTRPNSAVPAQGRPHLERSASPGNEGEGGRPGALLSQDGAHRP